MCYISTFAHDDEGHVHIALEFKMNCNLLSGMHLGLFFCVWTFYKLFVGTFLKF